MVQEVLTYIIVAFAFVYAAYGLVKIFIPAKSKHKCTGHCAGCSLKSEITNQDKVSFLKGFQNGIKR